MDRMHPIVIQEVMRRALNGSNAADPVYPERRRPRRRLTRRGTS